jgi:transposase-like protein
MEFTEEQIKRYIDSGGRECPRCGRTDIEGEGGINAEGTQAWQRIYCLRCHAQWTDVYKLTTIESSD